jgi:hypothetical protein
MNDKTDNIQITMDGISEMLSEIKSEIQSMKKDDNGESALKTDLLNKIIQIIDESKKNITEEELKAYSAATVAAMQQLQEEANTVFTRWKNCRNLYKRQGWKRRKSITAFPLTSNPHG